ncbi:MAG: alanine--tRNA ligase [Oscillospiraceae bacterium]|nr:alanine--tRNA ligase [Oscillospiraceae bacterium]
MKNYGLNELREMFLSFFESKGHLRLPSFSLIPQNDPSLLLINSGMAPMKPYFKGEQEPPRRRVCTCQKCIRTGDIENIGKTARHGTFFEMLGNFSFGDYFKKEAIAWSWEFLTSPEWVGLDPDRLYPSVYLDDDESFGIWEHDIGIPPERIFRFGKEDNFWEHGAGPCGPCSEIYYDRGEKYGCGKPTCTVGCDCDRYIEVWNNVFSQFDNDGNGNYTELVQKNIDTGMGLERLAVVCQEVDSLFDVDTVMHVTHRVSELTGAFYGESHKKDVSLRVITDHIRSAVFMISDGVLPSNEGRGYVLRRLIRRAARHGRLLGVKKAFLHEIVQSVVDASGGQYPELAEKQAYITAVIRSEEEKFGSTIDAGLRIFAELLEGHKQKGETVFSGADAFKLYDTYGFPLDLTLEMCADEGMQVDEEGFHRLMQEQRERARKAREALGDLGWTGVSFGKEIPETEFVGYDNASCEAGVLAMIVDDEPAGSVGEGKEAVLVLDRSVLYAEMGGQTADTGVIENEGFRFEVRNVQKNKGGKFMHSGVVTRGEVTVGDRVTVTRDEERRAALCRAHSATHLLHSALRHVLGEHVHQAGSLVEPDLLRFDFTHFSAPTQEELEKVALLVNESVLADYPVVTREMNLEDAKKTGAAALFGEKYADRVRVVNMGDWSIELCGGTHVSNTARIGSVVILSEGSVASGVRRIEALTGMAAVRHCREQEQILQSAAARLKTAPAELSKRLDQQAQEIRELRRSLQQAKDRESAKGADAILDQAEAVGTLKVLAVKTEGDANSLRKQGDSLRDKEPAIVALLAAVNGDKMSLLCVCGKDAVAAGVKAGDLIRKVSAAADGKGGGKPDSAMGGGNPGKLDAALKSLKPLVEEIIGKGA